MTDELALARVNAADKKGSNVNVSRIDLVKAFLHDLESGEIVADGLLLIYANRTPMGSDTPNWTYGTYRCGMTRDQEVLTLTMRQSAAIAEWKSS